MTTEQKIQTVGDLLIERRGDGYKSEAAREIGVSRQIYDAWESGHFVPGDEWAYKIAVYLERELEEIVLWLYNDREQKRAQSSAHNPRDDKPLWTPGPEVPEWAGRPIEIPATYVRLRAA